MKITKITFDPEADAAYIYTDNPNPVDHTAPLDHGSVGDYDADDTHRLGGPLGARTARQVSAGT